MKKINSIQLSPETVKALEERRLRERARTSSMTAKDYVKIIRKERAHRAARAIFTNPFRP